MRFLENLVHEDRGRLHRARHQQEFDQIELGYVAFDFWLETFSPRVAIDLRYAEALDPA